MGRNQGEHYYESILLDRICKTFVILQTQL